MKLKRLSALGLTLALSLSLGVTGASAATNYYFADIEKHWARDYIQEMQEKGLAVGWQSTDENGNTINIFQPDGKMTATETLLFCARSAQLDKATLDKIAADHRQEVYDALPAGIAAWKSDPARELAGAIQTGVLTLSELSDLAEADVLGSQISREKVCMYLVRAMQLEPLAKSLATYSLSYKDADDISPEYRPYVYVLTMYGVVNGTDQGTFNPKGWVTRAEMTTMLSRTLKAIDEMGISPELSEYTSYDWRGGVITNVTVGKGGAVILTLKSEVSGTNSYTLPAGVEIYKDNMLGDSDDLRAGQYARLNLNSNHTVSQVRLGGAVTQLSGSISSLADDQLSLQLTNGLTRNLIIDRFTEVAVGNQAGGRELIDPEAGYTTAVCQVDAMGHLAAVKFAGGTQDVEGFLSGVTTSGGRTTLTALRFDGVSYTYDVPDGIAVLLDGELSTLDRLKSGVFLTLRVGIDDNSLSGVVAETDSRFHQGPITAVGSIGTAKSITLKDVFSGKSETYTVSSSAAVTYDGEVKSTADVSKGWYVTVKESDGVIGEVYGFPGTVTVEGTITGITLEETTLLEVTRSDGAGVARYELNISDLPEITRSGKTSTVDKLSAGDTVVVTIRNNKVEKIAATPRSADLTGTISAINRTLSGTTLEIVFADGTSKAYALTNAVSITQDGLAISADSLKLGFTVGLVVDGDKLMSLEVTGSTSTSDSISGTVFTVDTTAKTMTIKVADGGTYTVNVKDATFMEPATGRTNLRLSDFSYGDKVTVWGSFDKGVYIATSVVKG